MFRRKLVVPLAIASLFVTTGCLEVDDDSNDELTAALLAQNELLEAQLEQSQQATTIFTVSITGLIVDAFDNTTPLPGNVTVRSATTVYAENIASTDGRFTVEELPANSELELIISSPDNSFLTRAFTVLTGNALSGNTERTVGVKSVSSGETFEIAVLNGETNMPIEGLEFFANTSTGLDINSEEFWHRSSFDEVNGVYSITLPEHLEPQVFLSNDVDRDGERDWDFDSGLLSNSGTDIFINYNSLENIDTILLTEIEEADSPVVIPVQFRLSVVNEAGVTITGAMIEATNDLETVAANFDEMTSQYIFDIDFTGRTTINIGAIEFDGESFGSGSLTISDSSRGEEVLSVLGNNIASNNLYYIDLSDVINLSVTLNNSSNNSNTLDVEVVSQSNPALNRAGEYSVFYSRPVTPIIEEVFLYSVDEFTVLRGNDSPDDLILPGNTRVTFGKPIPTTSIMSLNNTKLTIAPNLSLFSGSEHQYVIGDVRVIATNELFDLRDEKSFESGLVVGNTPFNINMIIADNGNFTNNGVPIVAENTAGDASSSFRAFSSVYLYLPDEINQLAQFSLSLRSFVENGTESARNRQFEIVRNRSITSEKVALVSVAENENLSSDSLINYSMRIIRGTSIAEDRNYYRIPLGESIPDNTDTEINSVTLDYAYETRAGDIETGTITLPIQ